MIYILLPVYNEIENLPALYGELTDCFKRHDAFYVFSDDGSTDGSQAKLKELFSNESHVILGDGTNRGPGYAFNNGFEWIVEHSKDPEHDKIISLEADCTADLSVIGKMITISDIGFDLVLASVYMQGGELEKTTWLRRLLSFFANMILRFKFDIKVLTLSSFYRLYSVDLIRKIKDRYSVIIQETGFISMIEILLKAINVRASIIEIPARLLSDRRKGVSKMKKFKTLISYLKFLRKTNIK